MKDYTYPGEQISCEIQVAYTLRPFEDLLVANLYSKNSTT